MQITAKEIAHALSGGKETRLSDNGYKCRCPTHDDKSSSLTVRDKSGKILIQCHAGCSNDTVIKELKARDLWPSKEYNKDTWSPILPVPSTVKDPGAEYKHPKYGIPVKRWTYINAEGELLGYVYRYVDPHGNKVPIPVTYCINDDTAKPKYEWKFKSFNKPRPMYGLELLARFPKHPVIVCEGEKATDAANELFSDHVAVSWPGGGKGVKHVDFSPLIGRDVTLWRDADEPGMQCMNQLAEILMIEGGQKAKMVELPEELEKVDRGWDVADEIPDGIKMDLVKMLKEAKVYEPVSEDVIKRMNSRYAFVLMGGKGAILRETLNTDTKLIDVDYLSVEGFKQYYSNVKIPVGRAFMTAGNYWFSSEERRQFERVDFLPGKESPGAYNLWRGYSFDPDPTGDWSMFREHLLENAAQGDEDYFNWIFAWFAQMMQKPWVKVGTSLSFRGKQGTGKTVIGLHMGNLIKPHYALVDDARYVFGNFNSHMSSTILLHSDEGFWGGDPKHVGKLRSMVTSEKQFIEYKGRDAVPVKNYMRLLITTNQNWVVPAASEERRFAVFDMGDGRQQETDYFRDMGRQLRHGGYGGLLHDLLHFDLSKVDISKIPNTAALQDQKSISFGDVARFWRERLMTGELLKGGGLGWKDPLSARLYELFVEEASDWGVRYKPSQTDFYQALSEIMPPDTGKQFSKANGSKADWYMAVAPLEDCRNYFNAINQANFRWLDSRLVEEPKQEHFNQNDGMEDDIPF